MAKVKQKNGTNDQIKSTPASMQKYINLALVVLISVVVFISQPQTTKTETLPTTTTKVVEVSKRKTPSVLFYTEAEKIDMEIERAYFEIRQAQQEAK